MTIFFVLERFPAERDHVADIQVGAAEGYHITLVDRVGAPNIFGKHFPKRTRKNSCVSTQEFPDFRHEGSGAFSHTASAIEPEICASTKKLSAQNSKPCD